MTAATTTPRDEERAAREHVRRMERLQRDNARATERRQQRERAARLRELRRRRADIERRIPAAESAYVRALEDPELRGLEAAGARLMGLCVALRRTDGLIDHERRN